MSSPSWTGTWSYCTRLLRSRVTCGSHITELVKTTFNETSLPCVHLDVTTMEGCCKSFSTFTLKLCSSLPTSLPHRVRGLVREHTPHLERHCSGTLLIHRDPSRPVGWGARMQRRPCILWVMCNSQTEVAFLTPATFPTTSQCQGHTESGEQQ